MGFHRYSNSFWDGIFAWNQWPRQCWTGCNSLSFLVTILELERSKYTTPRGLHAEMHCFAPFSVTVPWWKRLQLSGGVATHPPVPHARAGTLQASPTTLSAENVMFMHQSRIVVKRGATDTQQQQQRQLKERPLSTCVACHCCCRCCCWPYQVVVWWWWCLCPRTWVFWPVARQRMDGGRRLWHVDRVSTRQSVYINVRIYAHCKCAYSAQGCKAEGRARVDGRLFDVLLMQYAWTHTYPPHTQTRTPIPLLGNSVHLPWPIGKTGTWRSNTNPSSHAAEVGEKWPHSRSSSRTRRIVSRGSTARAKVVKSCESA